MRCPNLKDLPKHIGLNDYFMEYSAEKDTISVVSFAEIWIRIHSIIVKFIKDNF